MNQMQVAATTLTDADLRRISLALTNAAVTRDLPPADRDALERLLVPLTVAEDGVVFHAGAPVDSMILLATGTVSVSWAGSTAAAGHLAAPVFLGGAAFFTRTAHKVTVHAIAGATLYKLSRPAFESLAATHPSAASALERNVLLRTALLAARSLPGARA
jgi:CRP-like cAMP-binding protein